MHVPGIDGSTNLESWLDAKAAYEATRHLNEVEGRARIQSLVEQAAASSPDPGMVKLVARLIEHFGLEEVDYIYELAIPCKNIRRVLRSPKYPKLLVVDKDNGGKADALNAWLRRWHALVQQHGRSAADRRAAMHAVNPRYVLRNYLAQQAIDAATDGDASLVHTLLEVMRRPYDDQPEFAHFAARRPEWARVKAGCSMLSCSS